MAKTEDTKTVIQREEIDDYIWLSFDKALETLKFENDKAILKSARVLWTGTEFLKPIADGIFCRTERKEHDRRICKGAR